MTDDWTRAFYETPIAAAILTRTPEQVLRVADQVSDWMQLRPGQAVFEQCCGSGDVALELLRRGHPVVGVDISGPFIDAARARTPPTAPAVFERADARTWTSPEACDAGFNWGTGFGCSAQDEDNQAMLQAAADSLRGGAVFVLDYFNVSGVLAGFKPTFSYERDFEGRRVCVRRDSVLLLEQGLLHQQWFFEDSGRQTQMPRTTTRLYLPRTLSTMLSAAGFETEAFYGDYQGGDLTLQSPRCVVVARKKG